MGDEKERKPKPGVGWVSPPSVKKGFWHKWPWTGWAGKTLWDWQALLFIPVSIALIASLITLYQNYRQQNLENLRAERAIAEAYLEDTGTLLLEKNLRTEGKNSDVRLLARARTMAALDGVSGYRKVRLLEFLSETRLIQRGSPSEPPIISLRSADLRNTPLVRREILNYADLERAQLDNANMDDVELINTNLTGADLTGADLTGADLTGADLTEAILKDAEGGISCQETEDAKSLERAIMPNGEVYEVWLKEKGGC
jgi:hypothetical protein